MASASRLLTLITPSILRNYRNVPQSSPLKFNKPFPPPSLRFVRCSSSALTLDSGPCTDDVPTVAGHPWPEWVDFIDRLKAKGYLSEKASSNDRGIVVYKDMMSAKEACQSFARDRFDIFKSLSAEDIQIVVEKGCPNVFRKAVNSAKRLRAYLKLDEGDVCGSCNLRGSCDRAYVLLKDSEADARTVDIVRILLFYALDPLVLSGADKPPGREHIESASRKLLSELIKLGETPPDPELPRPASVTSQRKQQSIDLPRTERSKDVEMKPGDWVCTKCNFMNFARNIQCRMCKAEGPKIVRVEEVERKKGDWNCSQCSFMNFASNRQCFRCREPRPQRQLKPGDWECPECDFLNFSRNSVCKKCSHGRPQESATQVDDQTWKRPY